MFSKRKEIFIPRFRQESGVLPDTGLFQESTGFTLIELLAVIAIIALLAGVVVVRINIAKNKGGDVAIKTELREVAKAAEIYYGDNGTYEEVCDPADISLSDYGNFGRIKDYISKLNGVDGVIGCKSSKEAYAVISSLNLDECWCVDSEGKFEKVNLSGAADCRAKLTDTFCP